MKDCKDLQAQIETQGQPEERLNKDREVITSSKIKVVAPITREEHAEQKENEKKNIHLARYN